MASPQDTTTISSLATKLYTSKATVAPQTYFIAFWTLELNAHSIIFTAKTSQND